MKRIISIVLVLVMVLAVLASCGGGGDETTPAPTTTTEGTPGTTPKPDDGTTNEPTETTTAWWDNVPSFNTTLKIQINDYLQVGEMTAKGEIYMAGPANEESIGSNQVSRLVWERNQQAIAKLGITPTYVYNNDETNGKWGNQVQFIESTTTAATEDCPDIWSQMIYDMSTAMFSGKFRDILSVPDSHLNFETSHSGEDTGLGDALGRVNGWYVNWMKDVSLDDGEHMFLMGGDYFIDMIRALFVMPFNISLMDDNFTTLAPVMVNYAKDAGYTAWEDVNDLAENLSDSFYDLVLDDFWTYDLLAEFSTAIYQDTDSIAGDSFDDQLGFIASSCSGLPPAGHLWSGNLKLVDWVTDDEGTYLDYPAFEETKLYDYFQKMADLVDAAGTSMEPSTTKQNQITLKFAGGSLLFNIPSMMGSLEDVEYVNMKQNYEFGVVPMPKFALDEEYNALVHNIGRCGAISINSTKATAALAYVQMMNETSGDIVTEYTEIVMKYDVAAANSGTMAALDLIYSSINFTRDVMLDNIMHAQGVGGGITTLPGTDARWHGLLNGRYNNAYENISVWYEALTTGGRTGVKQTGLAGLVTSWNTVCETQDSAQ